MKKRLHDFKSKYDMLFLFSLPLKFHCIEKHVYWKTNSKKVNINSFIIKNKNKTILKQWSRLV